MKRRTFIQTSSLATLPILLNGMEVITIAQSSLANLIDPDSDRVLVLVRLNGGNDGLNTLIPLDQYDALAKARSNIIIPENKLLKLSDMNALHPSLGGWKEMYDEGLMNVVQSVAYPNQNRSHFRSTDIWHTASDADEYLTTGWLGRHFDIQYPNYPEAYPNDEYPDPFAITLGFVLSETCQGVQGNFSYAAIGSDTLGPLDITQPGESDASCYGKQLDFVRRVISQSNDYSSIVSDAFEKGNNIVEYPDFELAEQLKVVANLVSGGLKTKVYVVSLGGFDTHANQVVGDDPLNGRHTELMDILSQSIKAFQDDLIALGVEERVLGMTFSEFGRRIRSNDSYGTDHGTAAPMFLFGNCVKGGIIGDNPEIGDEVTQSEGVAMQYDFRSVYASVLKDWFGVDDLHLKEVLYKDFQYLPILKDCSTPSSVDEVNKAIDFKVSPNPTSENTKITFESNGDSHLIQVFDDIGSLVLPPISRLFSQGSQSLVVETNILPTGSYFVRLQNENRTKTVKLIKI